MAAQEAALNLAADAIGDAVVEVSLHTTNGSTDGSGEISGGTYDRLATTTSTWSAPSGGTVTLVGTLEFNAGTGPDTVTHLGFWAAGDTWLGSAALSASKTISSGDTLTITAAPITVSAA